MVEVVISAAIGFLIARYFYRRSPTRVDVQSVGAKVDDLSDAALTALAEIRKVLPDAPSAPGMLTVGDFDGIAESSGVRESVFQKLGMLAQDYRGGSLLAPHIGGASCPACGSEDIGHELAQFSAGPTSPWVCRACGNRWG